MGRERSGVAGHAWVSVLAATVIAVLGTSMGGLAVASPGGPRSTSRRSGAAPGYRVGVAVRSINPPKAMVAAGRFFLGGYGFSSGRVANQVPVLEGRAATGILRDGISTRALALGDGEHVIVLSQIETQGYFLAYQQGPYGLEDIREDASAAIDEIRKSDPGPEPPPVDPGAILVDSNHTHGGPDTVGAWGGVPEAYLQLVHDRTVDAIVSAYRSMRPARLTYGAVDAGDLLANQFGYDPANQSLDRELRVLQANDRDTGETIVTYVNFSAHPTVLGPSNTLITSDYTGVVQELVAQRYGGVALDQVATLGRTQPDDHDCRDARLGETDDECRLREYAARVTAAVEAAVGAATPLRGAPRVELHSYFVQDPATNGLLLSLTTPAGVVVGAPIMRSNVPPWASANLLGTVSFSGRIGDVVISGGPGEMYPQIVAEVRDLVPGHQGYLDIGTAGDFLGYLISPVEAYPEPVRRSLFDNSVDCGPIGCPSPVDNDNYLFNVSHTLGERLTCSLLRGAGDVFANDPLAFRSRDERCVLFLNDLAFPADADTRLPGGRGVGPGLPTG